MDSREVYEQWLANPYFDEATKEELKNIAEEENEIKERFYMDLNLVQLVCAESSAQEQTA